MTPIVALDTETTSLRPDRRAWEVAMIRRKPDGSEDDVTLYVETGDLDLGNADPFSLSKGGFHSRHPDYASTGHRAESEAFVAEAVERWTRGAHIVGAVPNFDTEVLGALLRRNGLLPTWHYHLIDVEALAVGYLNGHRALGVFAEPVVKRPVNEEQGEKLADRARRLGAKVAASSLPWDSDELSRACGVEPPSEDERHTALGDARWALRLYDAITGGADA